MNKSVIAKITHSECKDVLLKKYLRHSMNRIQSKNQKIGTYEINKIFLPRFDYKISILFYFISVLVGTAFFVNL